jgi:hypothetical protein
MATLEQLQARREQLLKDMASATKTLRHGETSREKYTPAEMAQQLALLDEEIANIDTTVRVRMVRLDTRDRS